jgi:hypothetical protein
MDHLLRELNHRGTMRETQNRARLLLTFQAPSGSGEEFLQGQAKAGEYLAPVEHTRETDCLF